MSGKTKWIFSTSWFMVPGGTIWGTTWFEVRGRIDRESVKGRAVELVVDLGWKRHRGPGFQAEGLCYRPDGSVIKAVNPDNCWIPLIDANGVANVELDDAGRFTVYVEAASNPLVEADLPFAPMNLGERADGRPSDYVLTTMDVCAFNQNVFDYLMDLETVTSLMRELKDDDPRYWQLAKALQRSLNTYDERDIAGTLEPAKEKLAGVLSEPAYSSVIHDKDLSRNAILLYGYSDGGGGPTREMVARIRRDHDLAGAPSIDFGTPDELFDRVRHDIVDEAPDETPVFKGELYLELHRATLTSQQEMKRGCRREENLLRTTEYLCAAASVFNPEYRYPREELDGIWKTLLLNQFHDILPGSAIAWVHRQARADYVRDIARLRDIAAEAGASIASVRDDADMRSNAAIVPYTAKNGDSWIARTAAVGTQDDDANGTDAVADESTIATTCDDGRIILDNGLLRAIIAPDGTVRSLIDLDNGHELVPDGSGIGHYELLRDEPYEWDAWDIQRDAFLSAEGIDDSHVERVTETKRGGATVHVSSTTDGVSIDACITLRAKSKSLEFRTKVDWRASERFLKVDIPMAIQADRAQYECQYGMVERPIQKNTRSDEAKYESCTHRFVRVADAGYAAAVVNASTYGSDVSPIHRNTASGPVRGTMIRLSLLSSPLYPDPNTDKGVHEFAWNVVADASMPAVLDEANRLNAAVLPAMPAFDPLAQLNPVDGVMVLDWVKLADDGSGDLILRVYEAVGGEAHARLAVNAALGKATVRECSIMEDARLDAELPAAFADGDPSVARTAQGAMLSLHPFQLATLRVSCGSDGGNTDGNESGSLR
ncbi:MAG: glycoside hydrolase family 38 C-terminal domain-containing protein [Bifidobacterium adolescentis]